MSDANSQLLNFACPKCQKKLRAPANLAGQKLSCPKCASPIRVPGVVESTNDDDDWLTLSVPDQPKIAPIAKVPKAIQPTRPASAPTSASPSVSAGPQKQAAASPKQANDDQDEFRLAPPEVIDSNTSAIPTNATSSNSTTAGKSVFDDDLPDLVPFDEPPVAMPIPTAVVKSNSTRANSTRGPASPPRSTRGPVGTPKQTLSLPDIALPDIALPDLESPALIGPMGSNADEEFNFPCKLCGSLLGSSHSKIGTQTRCPDCYSSFSVPSPPKRHKLADVKFDAEVAKVTFAPIDSLSVHGTNSSSEKTKEILDRAEQTMEYEREEYQDLSGSFNTKRWMGFLFGFLRDPLVIAAAVGLGFITGFWFFSMAAMGTLIDLVGAQVFIARIAILVVFCVPIVGAICMCGIAILTMGANRSSRVTEWPFLRLSESIGECMMVVASVMAASIPGGMLGVVFRSLNAHPMITLATILLGIWALTPILLLCMIDNSSIFEPYSKPVLNSIKSHSEAWGAMYMQTAMAFAAYFLFVVLTSIQTPFGEFMAGFLTPLACFFVFHQYGVLAGRISQVTEMGFEGDFSED